MSVYAYNTTIDGDLVTLVPAADTVEEMNNWWDSVHAKETQCYLTEAGLDHLMEDELVQYTLPVCIFPHKDKQSRENFIMKYSLVEVGNYVAIDHQKNMIAERDYEANLAAEKADTRTLAEVTGTDEYDQWDKQATEHDMNVMKGAPEGVTGDTSLGEGELKKTKEAVARDKEAKVLENAGDELKTIMVHLASLNIDLDTVMKMVDDLELDTDVAVLIKKEAKGSTPVDKVHADIDAEEAVISEVRKAMKKINDDATDDGVQIGIIGNREDADGNVHITAQVASDSDKKRWSKERTKQEAKDAETAKKEEENQGEIRTAAAAVGIDADAPNTYTGLKDDGTVIHRDDNLGISISVDVDGERKTQDITTGEELDATAIRKKELEAELRELDDHGTGEHDESLNPKDWVYSLISVTNPGDVSDDTVELGVYVALKDDYYWDQSCPIPMLRDDPFGENSEGFHSSTKSVQETRDLLNTLGLVEDDEFGDHIWDCVFDDIGNYGVWHKYTGEIVQSEESLKIDGDLINEDPTNFVFAAVADDDNDVFYILRYDSWNANKKWSNDEIPEWVDALGFSKISDSEYEHDDDIDVARQALLYKGAKELPEILMDQEAIDNYGWVPNALGSRAKIVAEEEKVNPEDYYFAILPPGFHCDDTTPILGQETFIVTMPKAEFDAGVMPQDKGGWFTEDELEKFGWEETENSVFSMEANVGDAYRLITQGGASENGKMLVAMGLDFNTIPFDWPYHYKADGDRKTRNEIQMDAVRILEAAREQGIVLSDEDGDIKITTAGVDQEAIAAEQQDVTKAFRKTMGLNDSETKNPEILIGVIIDEAINAAKAVVAEHSVLVDDVKLPSAIKDLIFTEPDVEYDTVMENLVTKDEAIKILELDKTSDPKAALRKRLKRGTTCKTVNVDGVDMVEIIGGQHGITDAEIVSAVEQGITAAWGTRKTVSDGSDYYFQLEDPRDSNAVDWAQDTVTTMDMLLGKDYVYCLITICPKAYYDAEGCVLSEHMSVNAGGALHLPDEFEETSEAEFIYHGPVATARKYLENMGMEEKVMNS